MIGEWLTVDGVVVQVIMKEPTHPEGLIWAAISKEDKLYHLSNNDLNNALHDKQIHAYGLQRN
jgi:hypothetical protein